MNVTESQDATRKPNRRWLRVTPDRVVFGLLALEGFLFLSRHFRWFWFNEYPPATELIAVLSLGGATLLLLLWFVLALIFRWQFRFSMRAMLLLVLADAIAFTWLVKEARRQRHAAEAVERAIAADADDKPDYEAFKIAHAFPYSARPERKDRITENYTRLRVGLSKAETAAILGDPDYSHRSRAKGPRREYLGSSWTYCLEKRDPNNVNLKHDKTVKVFFAPGGKVTWVVSNVEGLAEIGRMGR